MVPKARSSESGLLLRAERQCIPVIQSVRSDAWIYVGKALSF